MAGPDSIPDLQTVIAKSDGSLYNRVEAEQRIREQIPKIYHRRMLAKKQLGLPMAPAFDMKDVVLLHWMLDELTRQGKIVGEVAGVNVSSYGDENEQRQFSQRLTALIQSGQALQPKDGEGVDMNAPGTPPGNNGAPQQGFVPPAPPMGIGVPPGYQPPQPPQGFVPQGPPQGFVPQGPPQGPPQGYVPPQGPPQTFTPQGPPMMPPGYAPQQGVPQGPPMSPPQAAPQQPAAPPPARRTRKAATEAPAQQAQAPAPQQQFAPLPQQAQIPLPQQPAFQQMAPAAPAQVSGPPVDLGPLLQMIQQQGQQIAALTAKLNLMDMGIAVMVSAAYAKAGSTDLATRLKELGLQLPQ